MFLESGRSFYKAAGRGMCAQLDLIQPSEANWRGWLHFKWKHTLPWSCSRYEAWRLSSLSVPYQAVLAVSIGKHPTVAGLQMRERERSCAQSELTGKSSRSRDVNISHRIRLQSLLSPVLQERATLSRINNWQFVGKWSGCFPTWEKCKPAKENRRIQHQAPVGLHNLRFVGGLWEIRVSCLSESGSRLGMKWSRLSQLVKRTAAALIAESVVKSGCEWTRERIQVI